ncbi:hypothetical protein [Streptomyces sp. NPDC056464]
MPSRSISRTALTAATALTLTAGAALTVSIALPAVAGAATPPATATAAAHGSAIGYLAAPGQTNEVTVTATSAEGLARITYVIDDVVPITAGEG